VAGVTVCSEGLPIVVLQCIKFGCFLNFEFKMFLFFIIQMCMYVV
jgi:hypothetical protein